MHSLQRKHRQSCEMALERALEPYTSVQPSTLPAECLAPSRSSLLSRPGDSHGSCIPPAKLANERIECGREDKTENRNSHHPKQHRSSKGLTHFCARSGCHRKRGHAQDERE